MKNNALTFSVAVFAAATLLLSACNGRNDKNNVIEMDNLAEKLEEMQSGDSLMLRGFCVDVCTSGANHITLQGEDTTKVIAVIADDRLISFDNDLKYQYVTVHGVMNEQRVDSTFLQNWEARLDESLKAPDGGNPPAVAMLKRQIAELRDSIAARYARSGKNYWSNYTIVADSYTVDE